ncbi:MAG TPA: type VII secretion protein EccCa, partial [Micromonosporaceae bacterium]
ALLFAGRQGGAYSYVIGGVFGLSSLGMLATSMVSGAGRRERIDVAGLRREYAKALGVVRARARANTAALRTALGYRHPAPETLVTIVDSGRLWERRPGDADFGAVRVGLGPQALTTPLVPAPGTTDDLDPISSAAMRRLISAYGTVRDLPVAIATDEFARIYVNDAGLVRALLAQLAFAHSPADLLIAVCAAPERAPAWDYLKWLPHHQHPRRIDATGPERLVASRLGEMEALLGDILDQRPAFTDADRPRPQVVIVLDGSDRTGAKRLVSAVAGCCVVEIGDRTGRPSDAGPSTASASAISLTVTPDGRMLADDEEVGRPDALSMVEAEALARALAPLRSAANAEARSPSVRSVTLDGLLDLDQRQSMSAAIGALRAGRSGRQRSEAERLRVPIGTATNGTPVLLDLKEAARDGMGPHGLLIGATGSGKSELLRTLVLSLAASHASEDLNFVLIDFKGGATFSSLDRLPHTAAVITNLADELPLVDRMTDALNGELVRRQEMLRRAGNLGSRHDYERVRAADPAMPPMPVLLIV